MRPKKQLARRRLTKLLCLSVTGLFAASCSESSAIQAADPTDSISSSSTSLSMSAETPTVSEKTDNTTSPAESSSQNPAISDESAKTSIESRENDSHQYGDWSTVKEPTCDQPGEEVTQVLANRVKSNRAVMTTPSTRLCGRRTARQKRN